MSTSNVDARMSPPVRVRLAESDDAERITTVINSAFRRAEEFFVDGDRIEVGSVLDLLNSGKFLLAEREGTLLGCVYVEPRPFPLNDATPATDESPGKEDSDLGDDTKISQSEIPNPKFSRAYLGLLAVDPAHQQSGLGSMLMNAAEDYGRRLRLGFMDIKVVNLRVELSDFYRRRGYVETGTSAFPTEVETRLPCHFIEMSKRL